MAAIATAQAPVAETVPESSATTPDGISQAPVLSPASAWRFLCYRTGLPISRATFYRWLSSGKVFSFRIGRNLYIPAPVMEELVKHCRAGERF